MSTNYIDQITDTAGTTHDISEGDSTRIFRATCSTAASTAAKVATLDTSNRNFSLTTGVRVAVTFKYGNSATTPTLRVDGSSTGTAKTIAFSTGSAARSTGNGTTYNTWGPYETVIFTYDGTYWVNSGSALGIYNAYNQAAAAGSGTVTSVGITDGGGLTITGSPVTTSGSITVGHTNSVTAQTTQAVYPIKIDAQGHISAYGSAVTIPTDTNTTYSLSNALSSHKFTSTLTAGGSGSGTSTATMEFAAGTGITLTDDTTNKKITIASSITVPTITLNGSSTTSPSFYAPTGAGTSGYVLKSNGSGAPSWTSATLTDENVKSTTVTSATTNYIVGSTSSSTATGGLSKHASALIYTTADSGTSGYTQLRLGNTTATTSAGGKEGQIRLYGTGATYYLELKPGAVSSSNKTITFPNKTGTVALTSDIPDVSGFITSDSDEKVKVAAGSATGTDYYPVLATGAGTATRQYLNTIRFLGDSNYGTQFILGKNDGTQGLIQLWSKTSGYYVSISPADTLTANRGIKLPDKDGTFALTSDLSDYVAKSGDTMTGALTMANGKYFQGKNANGDNRIICGISADNTYMFGYGSRNSSEGSSFFDGHVVNIRSNGLVNITAPDGVTNTGTYNDLVKITPLPVAPGQISANSYKTATTTVSAESGYKPVGIIGYSSSSSNVFPFTYYLTSDTSLYTEFKNVSSSAVTPTFSFKILWLKATGTRTNS